MSRIELKYLAYLISAAFLFFVICDSCVASAALHTTVTDDVYRLEYGAYKYSYVLRNDTDSDRPAAGFVLENAGNDGILNLESPLGWTVSYDKNDETIVWQCPDNLALMPGHVVTFSFTSMVAPQNGYYYVEGASTFKAPEPEGEANLTTGDIFVPTTASTTFHYEKETFTSAIPNIPNARVKGSLDDVSVPLSSTTHDQMPASYGWWHLFLSFLQHLWL